MVGFHIHVCIEKDVYEYINTHIYIHTKAHVFLCFPSQIKYSSSTTYGHPQGGKFKATESRNGQGKEKDRGKGKCLERIYVSFLFDLKWELNSNQRFSGFELHGYSLSNMFLLIAWFQSLDALFTEMQLVLFLGWCVMCKRVSVGIIPMLGE